MAELWRFPVKSMQGERLGSVDLGASGAEGDRSFALIDRESGKVMSAKRWGALLQCRAHYRGEEVVVTLPDGSEHGFGDPATDEALSEWLGRPVSLMRATNEGGASYETGLDPLDAESAVIEFPCPPGTFHDAAAAHLMTTAALRWAASAEPGSSWDIRRFRPGILIDAEGEEIVEEGWIGSELHIATAVLTPFAPTVRCAMPTRAQPALTDAGEVLAELSSDKTVIRTLTDRHNNCLGVYAAVRSAGTIAVGDEVVLIG